MAPECDARSVAWTRQQPAYNSPIESRNSLCHRLVATRSASTPGLICEEQECDCKLLSTVEYLCYRGRDHKWNHPGMPSPSFSSSSSSKSPPPALLGWSCLYFLQHDSDVGAYRKMEWNCYCQAGLSCRQLSVEHSIKLHIRHTRSAARAWRPQRTSSCASSLCRPTRTGGRGWSRCRPP